MDEMWRRRCRDVMFVMVASGLVFQASPAAWAQLQDIDPALHAAVEALVATDTAVSGDPELAQLCRDLAEASVSDIRERAAIEGEAAALVREGVDLNELIPTEVREAARAQFTEWETRARTELETLRAADPERAREMELMLREGDLQMRAFEAGERYTPSPEMATHAREMFAEWKETMSEQGAPPEMLARAETEFARWSSGEMMGPMGGPGPGGQDMMGPGSMPSLEQMEGMVAAGQMTSEQLQMAKDYMANPQEFMSAHAGFETFGPEAMGMGGPPGGGTWEGGPQEGMNFEAYGPSPIEAFEQYAAEHQMTPEMETQYREMAEQFQREFENQNYDTLQQQQFDLVQPPSPSGETLVRTETHVADHNMDGDTVDPVDTHPHEIYRHADGTCHDHGDQSAETC